MLLPAGIAATFAVCAARLFSVNTDGEVMVRLPLVKASVPYTSRLPVLMLTVPAAVLLIVMFPVWPVAAVVEP